MKDQSKIKQELLKVKENSLLKQKIQELEHLESDSMRAKEELRKSEEKYRSIIENMEEGYHEVDLRGNFTLFNESMCKMMGYEREDLLGMNNRQYADEENTRKIYQVYNQVYQTGESVKNFEWQIIRKDGDRRYNEVSISLIRNPEGHPIGFQGIVRDITERKWVEESLQLTNLKLLAIIDNLPFLAWIKDSEGRFMAVNEPFASSCGFSSANDLVGKTDLDIWPKHLAEAYNADDFEVMRSRQKKTVEELIDDQGVQKWFETYKAPLCDLNDNVIGTTGFSRDITERRQARDMLKKSEETYRLITDNSNDWIYLINQDGKFKYVSPSSKRLTGYPSYEFINNQELFMDIIHPDDKEQIKSHLEILKENAKAHNLEFRIITKEGELRWISHSCLPVYNDQGQYSGRSGTNREITERKQAEEKLLQTLESLRRSFGTTVQVMVSAVETRDPYTSGHQIRVANIARAIATEMGLPKEKIEGIRMAGSIHDIGKLSIPAEILSKPGKLSEIEFSLIKEHARKGYEMLKDVESPWPLAEIVYQHHERIDGSGYPRNLKEDEILLEARILSVADVMEAMSSHRPYRPGLGIEAALNEIEKNRGIFYDKTVADACLRLFREKGFQLEGA